MMLGLLLARAGVDVVVLEKHADFLRDFRGDTIHPSTLEVMHELGLLDEFLRAAAPGGARGCGVLDRRRRRCRSPTSRHLPTRCRFIAFMPQWDFLDFLAGEARALPGVPPAACRPRSTGADRRGRPGRRRARDDAGRARWRSAPTSSSAPTAAHSTRPRSWRGCAVEDLGAPIDVLWLRLSRRPGDPAQTHGPLRRRARPRHASIAATTGSAATSSRRAAFDAIRGARARRVPRRARRGSRRSSPIASASSRDWDDVKLLTVQVDRLRRWYRPGLLCIGDAAHAMSPVGGVGINLAIQDAVAAANRPGGAAARRDGSPRTTWPRCSGAASSRPASRSASSCWRRSASCAGARAHRAAAAARRAPAPRPLPGAAADPGPPRRPRRAAGARASGGPVRGASRPQREPGGPANAGPACCWRSVASATGIRLWTKRCAPLSVRWQGSLNQRGCPASSRA